MEADWESGYLLSLRRHGRPTTTIPNSKEASMGKAKAGRMATDVTLKTVELAGTTGYSEQTLLEKWAPRLQDPGHLRGHPADPAAGGRPPVAGPAPAQVAIAFRRSRVSSSSSMDATSRFSSRWLRDEVPGISRTLGATSSGHATRPEPG